jgi:uncharacterized protein YutE (UPF0331/DUF86 family)
VVDRDLLLKKLAFVETCVRELRTLARPELIGADVREERFIVHTLQLAAQAALDVASHIVSDQRLGEPETNRQLFELLEGAGWVDTELSRSMREIAGFRNVVVHGYEKVDLRIVADVLRNRLGDLLDFVGSVHARLGAD